MFAQAAACGRRQVPTASASSVREPERDPSRPEYTYRLFIDTLRAYETEDGFEDEAYIRVKGSTVWGPNDTTALQMEYPNVVRDVTGPIWISLYGEDGWPDPDDWLGDAYAPLPAYVGSTAYGNLWFTRDGANYVMTVRVLRLS
jgi:hypothetical protein